MRGRARKWIAVAVVVLCGALGWWLAYDVGASFARERPAKPVAEVAEDFSRERRVVRRGERRGKPLSGGSVEMMASFLPDQAILRFPTDESYWQFAGALEGTGVVLVERLDRLRAMRLEYDEPEDLAELIDGGRLTVYPALSTTPVLVGAGVDEGAVGFGDGLMPWLGITGDNSRWGKGVKVAVLDSGIVPHEALPGLTVSIAVVPYAGAAFEAHGHGTAVASLIAGNHPQARGIAPAAELISVRVTTDEGVSDSFALAAGMLAAMDANADLINLSLGSYENSPLLEEAVRLAMAAGIVVVAASGNEAQPDARYPAGYSGVVGVGSVDARGLQLGFANYGDYLTLTAPGLAVPAAWPDGKFIRMTGTSASAPLVTGAIAAAMSDGRGPRISATAALKIVTDHANEAGLPGPDSEYGIGILDVGRIMNRRQPGRVDAAITDQRLVRHKNGGSDLLVTVQNRGTEILTNTLLEVTLPTGPRWVNATTIAPGAVHTFTIAVDPRQYLPGAPFAVTSKLTLGTSVPDLTPENNVRTDVIW